MKVFTKDGVEIHTGLFDDTKLITQFEKAFIGFVHTLNYPGLAFRVERNINSSIAQEESICLRCTLIMKGFGHYPGLLRNVNDLEEFNKRNWQLSSTDYVIEEFDLLVKDSLGNSVRQYILSEIRNAVESFISTAKFYSRF